jgi:esterase/lipase superfamily enzyme
VDALSDHLLESKKNIPVWYGTNRRPRDILREQDGFLNEADLAMHYGYCMVNVPKRYVKGGSGRGWLMRLLNREPTELEFGNVNPLPQEKFWSKLAGTLRKQTDANAMLLFVHGYNVSFEDAANSAGQLSYELDLPVSFFSWSSHRTLKDYAGDKDQSVESVQHLKEFLGQLWQSAASTGKRLHVIAHSMGNRALLQALHEIALAARPDGPQLAQVIFAAPDVSRTLFLQQLAAVVKHPGLTAGHTLYASSDKALLASGWLHDNTRAGFLPPVTTAQNLATVDVSRYDLSLLGHSYVFNLGPVLEDMFAVLHDGKPRLRSLVPGGLHWVLG